MCHLVTAIKEKETVTVSHTQSLLKWKRRTLFVFVFGHNSNGHFLGIGPVHSVPLGLRRTLRGHSGLRLDVLRFPVDAPFASVRDHRFAARVQTAAQPQILLVGEPKGQIEAKEVDAVIQREKEPSHFRGNGDQQRKRQNGGQHHHQKQFHHKELLLLQ